MISSLKRLRTKVPLRPEAFNHYVIFRVLMGSYLLVHFAQLYGSGPELFSNEGMFDSQASPFHVLQLPLFFFDSPGVIQTLLASAALASGLLLWGRYDRIASAWLWMVLASLTMRNPLINNPSLPYIGWLLLAHATVGWNHPRWRGRLRQAAWIVMAVGYSYSGITKWTSPSWADGTALLAVLENPLARSNLLQSTLTSVPALLVVMTYSVLVLESLFAPLAAWKRTRGWVWLLMLLSHLGILCLIDFADLTWGMLILHAFTFNPRWLRSFAPQDRSCGA